MNKAQTNKKRVCIVVYDISDMGGTNQVASSLAAELVKKYDLYVLSIRKNREDIPHAFPDGVPITVLLDGTKNVKDTVRRCFLPAKKYFRENKIDVALLIGHFAGFIMSVLRPFVKTKLVFCDHGALLNQLDDKQETLMRRIGVKLCNKLVALTKRTRDDYIRLFHLKPSKADYIYNWIDYDPNVASTYSADYKRIMWAGRFSPEKGNDMMYEVALDVLKRNTDWSWDVYGDGDTLEFYREKAEKDGISDRLIFHGRVSDLKNRYAGHGIYVLSSYREGLPLVLLEAKANFLPIVSFDVVTGPAEIVRNGVDGYLIEPKNTAAMAECLNDLMNDPEKREKLSGESHSNLGLFSKSAIFEKWCSLIDELA